ncbi:ABC transporter transmembrane domain-containing protein [Streptomyces johnsoniae]|uniref:ABC transporter transmembrane domain-containing protein n=1 Tax=Streptomyces johnsoniae TaxID=3075532 RepID=UPI00374E01A3
MREQNGDLTTAVTESVLGIRVVKSFGHQRSLIRAFQRRAARLRGTELRKARLLATLSALLMALPEAALGAALALGAVQVADGETSAGTLVAFLAIALELRPAMTSTGLLLAMSSEAATAADRYADVMDEPAPAEPADFAANPNPNPNPNPDLAPAPAPNPAPAALAFENVALRHPGADGRAGRPRPHLADRAVVIDEGRVVEDGPPSELLARLDPGLLPRRAVVM